MAESRRRSVVIARIQCGELRRIPVQKSPGAAHQLHEIKPEFRRLSRKFHHDDEFGPDEFGFLAIVHGGHFSPR